MILEFILYFVFYIFINLSKGRNYVQNVVDAQRISFNDSKVLLNIDIIHTQFIFFLHHKCF